MRDKREPTATNGTETDVLADRLPKVLATRLRAARNAVGLSQGAVAKAMNDRGFSWRQTTVAKSEAADRPVLFAEVAALAQIYKREIEYFLYPGTELDSLLDEALSEMASIQDALVHAERSVAALQGDLRLYECTIGVASAIRRYRISADSGPLLADLRALLLTWGYRCLTLYDVYESVEITRDQLEALDSVALLEVAKIEQYRFGRLSLEAAMEEGAEMVTGVSAYIEGKPVSEALLEVLREGGEWAAFAAPLLTDLVVAAVNAQLG